MCIERSRSNVTVSRQVLELYEYELINMHTYARVYRASAAARTFCNFFLKNLHGKSRNKPSYGLSARQTVEQKSMSEVITYMYINTL